MAPLNLTNVSSAITDEAKDPPMRTIRIDANKLFFMTAPPFLFFYFLKVERDISVKEVADLSIKDAGASSGNEKMTVALTHRRCRPSRLGFRISWPCRQDCSHLRDRISHHAAATDMPDQIIIGNV